MKTLSQNPQLMKNTVSLLISFLQNELQKDDDLLPENFENDFNSSPHVTPKSNEKEEEEDEDEVEDEFDEEEEDNFQDLSMLYNSATKSEQKTMPNTNALENPLVSKTSTQLSESDIMPGYPIHGKPLEKVIYLSNKSPWFWCLREMQVQIEKIEGDGARETLKSFRQKIHNWVHTKALVSIRVNDNRKLVFYGLRQWVDTKTMNIKPGYGPKPEYLRGMSVDDLRKVRIAWNGIQ